MKSRPYFSLLVLLLQFGILASCNRPGTSPHVAAAPSLEPKFDTIFDPTEQISEYVRRIFLDSKGRLWMGTNGDGAYVHDGKQLRRYGKKHGLAGSQVTGIQEGEPGQIWFATDQGVSVFDGNGFNSYTEEDGLVGNHVWSIFRDSKGTIWAGTESGLCRLDGDRFVALKLPASKIVGAETAWREGAIFSLMEDQSGNLWIGADGMGVYVYDGAAFTQITTQDGLCDNTISSMITDPSGGIWLASMFGGLSRYDGRTFQNFTQGQGDIGDNECGALLRDRAGHIWFSCEGFGIYRHDGQSISRLGEERGLMVKAVQCIIEDEQGRLWVGGGGGLYRYDGMQFVNVLKGGPWN